MRTFYRQIPSIAVFVILLLLASCPASGEKSGTSSSSGKSGTPGGTWTGNAVDFSYTSYDGKPGKASDYAGQPLVLNFWADGCPPCVSEFPDFQAVYNEQKGKFVLLSVALEGSLLRDPEGFVKKNGYSWTFVRDGDGGATYGIRSIPTTYFIDRRGNIVDQFTGAINKSTFQAALKKIL